MNLQISLMMCMLIILHLSLKSLQFMFKPHHLFTQRIHLLVRLGNCILRLSIFSLSSFKLFVSLFILYTVLVLQLSQCMMGGLELFPHGFLFPGRRPCDESLE